MAPEYLKNATSDQLFRMIEQMASEMWVLRDRLSALEVLLEQKGIVTRQSVDAYVPEGEAATALARDRHRMVSNIFGAPFAVSSGPISPGP